jgi:hypothetical protein
MRDKLIEKGEDLGCRYAGPERGACPPVRPSTRTFALGVGFSRRAESSQQNLGSPEIPLKVSSFLVEDYGFRDGTRKRELKFDTQTSAPSA